MLKDVAIILLNYNGSEDTIECIKSLDSMNTEYGYDVYIIDNDSRKEEAEVLIEYIKRREDFSICLEDVPNKGETKGNVLILSNDNVGFAGGNNRIIRAIYKRYEYILLLNNDTVVKTDFLKKMLDLMNEDKEIGFASCKINNYYNRELLWNCGGVLRPWGLRKYYSDAELSRKPEVINAEFITGCALFIRSSIIEKYGALSDDFFHGEEDFNFCWRMKKYHVKGRCINRVLVYHKVNATSNKIGLLPGKVVGYFACRIVDMKQFYSKPLWNVWKLGLTWILKLRWIREGYSKDEIKKMLDILSRVSKQDSIDRDDTLKIWKLTY
jgi:GT2 family glycosyltransferase